MHAVRRCIRHALLALVRAAALGAALSSGVRAEPHHTCVLDGQSVMAFGNYDSMSNSALELQGRVSYRCFNDHGDSRHDDHGDNDHGNGKITVQISLSAGNAGGFNRYMAGERDRLQYNLYLDPQRQTVWGDGTGGTRVYSEHAQPNNHLVSVPVYGRIFGAQDVSAGTYLDNLIVTLDF